MEGVVKFSPRPVSHRVRGRGRGRKAYNTTSSNQASPHPMSHRARGWEIQRTKQASPHSMS